MKVDWHYHRNGCITCKRMQAFLEDRSVESKEITNATKERFDEAGILEIARAASRIVVAKGKKVLDFNMKKDPPDDETLLKHLRGPSGNLRAPTLRIGKTLVVGFHAEDYPELFDQLDKSRSRN